jgi:hypothetical protein
MIALNLVRKPVSTQYDYGHLPGMLHSKLEESIHGQTNIRIKIST